MEWSFSHGHILISHLHNRLCADTIQALMCFGDWLREDLVSNAKSVEFLKDKGKGDNVIFVDNELFTL